LREKRRIEEKEEDLSEKKRRGKLGIKGEVKIAVNNLSLRENKVRG